MKKRLSGVIMSMLLGALVLSIPVAAGGPIEEPSDQIVTEQIKKEPLTPEGNMTLVDDIGTSESEGKQFLTVVTKKGNYFYLIIDRDAQGKETVHFLNQVDEADLLSLMDEDEVEVLKENSPSKTEEVIIEPIKEEPVPEKEISRDRMTSPILLVLLIAACGGVLAVVKLGKKKKASVPTVPEDQEEECEGFIELEDELYEMEEGDYESV